MAYDAVGGCKQQGENKRANGVDKQISVFPLVVWRKATHYAVGCKNEQEHHKIVQKTALSDIFHIAINKVLHYV